MTKKKTAKKAATKKASPSKQSARKPAVVAASKKKTSASKPAAKSAAKKSTAKKTASRAGKPVAKKTAEKKPAPKKAVTKKTSPAKAGAPKKTAKKPAPKSAPSKKVVKKASSKKAPAKKALAKKAVAKKAPVKKATASKKASKKTGAGTTKKISAKKVRGKHSAEYLASQAVTLTDARAAASRLAAAAGLPSLRQRTPEVVEEVVAEKKVTKSPLKKRDLDKYRVILRTKRSEVAGDVFDMESEALGKGKGELSNLPQHTADQGSDEADQSLSLGLAQSQRTLLKEIDAALVRIEKRTYGVCEALGVPIPKERLDVTPWTRYSVEGARMNDRGVLPS